MFCAIYSFCNIFTINIIRVGRSYKFQYIITEAVIERKNPEKVIYKTMILVIYYYYWKWLCGAGPGSIIIKMPKASKQWTRFDYQLY